PDGLEDEVGEAQDHQVLDGLFAEIMIDAKGRIFVEISGQLLVDFARAREVMSDRLLDNDAREPICGRRRHPESRLLQVPGADFDKVRWYREIEDMVAAAAVLLIDSVELLLQFQIILRFGEGPETKCSWGAKLFQPASVRRRREKRSMPSRANLR